MDEGGSIPTVEYEDHVAGALNSGFNAAELALRKICEGVFRQWQSDRDRLQGRAPDRERADFFLSYDLLLDFNQNRPRWRWVRKARIKGQIRSLQMNWKGRNMKHQLLTQLDKLNPALTEASRRRGAMGVRGMRGKSRDQITPEKYHQLCETTFEYLKDVEDLRAAWQALKSLRRNSEKVTTLSRKVAPLLGRF